MMSARLKFSVLVSLLLVLLMALAVIPGLAQDTPVETELAIVTGAVEFGANGEILVAGTVIAPSSGFNPSILKAGDIVIITGTFNPDGTLKALSLEFFDGEVPPEVTPEVTPEITPEATPELTPEATLEVTPELTPEATLVVTPETTADAACNGPSHPVGQAIAETFGVPYEEVMAFHCSGMGFGNIVRAYSLAKASGGTAKEYLERHQNGEGWGNIRKDSGVDPSALAPGRVLKPNKKGDDAAQPTLAPQTGPGNGNGGGKKDKDNNGNGNGNGNNNGGGNGNGGGKGGGKK